MKIAYFDCFSGAAGDMVLGALLDAGLALDDLKAALAGLNVGGYDLRAERVSRGGIGATKLHVLLHEGHEHKHEHARPENGHEDSHSTHQHEHPHGDDHQHEHHEHEHSHDHEHGKEHGHEHSHDHERKHSHEHGHEGGHHVHGRHLPEILGLIEASPLSDSAKANASRIFRRLAEAEGAIHGKPPEQVHFHEVGAVDSIVDIVGAAAALDLLGVEGVFCSPFRVGTGTVRCAHGEMPVPAPATARLLAGMPIVQTDSGCELTTPSGAAILSTLAQAVGPMPACRISSIGYGAGSRDTAGRANVLRVFIGETAEGAFESDVVEVIEANIDDMPPEFFGAIFDRILAAGALDVWASPIHMKKGRPALLLSAAASPANAAAVRSVFFRETTTFGVRAREMRRWKLPREMSTVSTRWGDVRVKIGRLDGRVVRIKPEHDDCVRIATAHGLSFTEVYDAARAAFVP